MKRRSFYRSNINGNEVFMVDGKAVSKDEYLKAFELSKEKQETLKATTNKVEEEPRKLNIYEVRTELKNRGSDWKAKTVIDGTEYIVKLDKNDNLKINFGDNYFWFMSSFTDEDVLFAQFELIPPIQEEWIKVDVQIGVKMLLDNKIDKIKCTHEGVSKMYDKETINNASILEVILGEWKYLK